MELQMQYLPHHNSAVNSNVTEKKMKRTRCSSAKVERKIVEKNRRNHMKNLYSTLNSLLPHNDSKEPLSIPDQIDEAVNYMKSLKAKLNESKEKKETLMREKRSLGCIKKTKSPEIKINENGSIMEVVLMTGPDSRFMFYDMICMFHEHGAEVLNASLSTMGNMVFHVVHAEIGACVGAQMIKDELNKFVRGSSFEDELQQELWDFEIHPETWDFTIM